MVQLVVPMAKLQRQMHEEDRAVLELELDDEAFDALVEVVKALAVHPRSRQKRVALLAQDRQTLIQRRSAVLTLIHGVMPEGPSDDVGLIDAARSDRAGVDLDEADDVRVLRLDEVRDSREVGAVAEQVAHARQRPVQSRAQAEAVTNVVKQ
jgi:hypothetical protein